MLALRPIHTTRTQRAVRTDNTDGPYIKVSFLRPYLEASSGGNCQSGTITRSVDQIISSASDHCFGTALMFATFARPLCASLMARTHSHRRIHVQKFGGPFTHPSIFSHISIPSPLLFLSSFAPVPFRVFLLSLLSLSCFYEVPYFFVNLATEFG